MTSPGYLDLCTSIIAAFAVYFVSLINLFKELTFLRLKKVDITIREGYSEFLYLKLLGKFQYTLQKEKDKQNTICKLFFPHYSWEVLSSDKYVDPPILIMKMLTQNHASSVGRGK